MELIELSLYKFVIIFIKLIAIYFLIGLLYKRLDKLTGFDTDTELAKGNVAVAIFMGSVISLVSYAIITSVFSL